MENVSGIIKSLRKKHAQIYRSERFFPNFEINVFFRIFFHK